MDLIVSTTRPRGRLTPFVGAGLAVLVAGSLVMFTMLAERADIGLGDPRGIIPTAPDAAAQRTVVLPGSPNSVARETGDTRVIAPLLPPVPIGVAAEAPAADDGGSIVIPPAPDPEGPVIAGPRTDGPSIGSGVSRGPSFAPEGSGGTPDLDGCDDSKHDPKGKGRGHCKHSKKDKNGPRQQPARQHDSDDDDDDDESDDSDDYTGGGSGSGSGRDRSARGSSGHAKSKGKRSAGQAQGNDAKDDKKRATGGGGHDHSNGHSNDSGGSNGSGGSGDSND